MVLLLKFLPRLPSSCAFEWIIQESVFVFNWKTRKLQSVWQEKADEIELSAGIETFDKQKTLRSERQLMESMSQHDVTLKSEIIKLT